MDTIRRVKLNRLPRSVREHLFALLAAEGDPTLVRWFPGRRDSPIAAAVVAAIALAVGGYLIWWLIHEASRSDPWFNREAYFGLAGVLFLFFVAALGLLFRVLWKPPPHKWGARFATGGYLAYVDRDEVRVVALAALGTPTITNVLQNGAYQRSHLNFSVGNVKLHDPAFSFVFERQGEAERFLAELDTARAVFDEAARNRDERALREIDPFAACTLSGVWEAPGAPGAPGDGGPTVVERPAWAGWARWLGALVLGGAVALTLFSILKSACAENPDCHSLSRPR
jgi:hypothetical protein